MKLFLDFDGVVNFDASRSAYNRNPDCLGYLRRSTLPADGNRYNVNYSAELVRKLNGLKADYGFTWLWLTTWVHHSMTAINPFLDMHGDDYVRWDPDTGVTRLNVSEVRNARKYDALKANYDGEPFIWVDDEATVLFNKDDFDVPHLVLTPNSLYGLTKGDLTLMNDFLAKHGGKN